jgi:hypothetical protein
MVSFHYFQVEEPPLCLQLMSLNVIVDLCQLLQELVSCGH